MELTPKDHDLAVASPRTLGPRTGKAALLVMLPALLVLEWTLGSAFSLSLFYLLPVALASWNFGYRAGFAIAALAAGYCIFVAVAMHPANLPYGPVVWQSATTAAMFALFAWATAYHRHFIDRVLTFARIDVESGALSNREFRRVLDAEMKRAKRYGHPLAVVLLEANGPKQVLARQKRLARTLGETLRGKLREGDFVARSGPRQFALLLLECNAPEALIVAARAREAVERIDVRIAFAFSVASYGATSPTTAAQLLERAERRLATVREGTGRGTEQVAFA